MTSPPNPGSLEGVDSTVLHECAHPGCDEDLLLVPRLEPKPATASREQGEPSKRSASSDRASNSGSMSKPTNSLLRSIIDLLVSVIDLSDVTLSGHGLISLPSEIIDLIVGFLS